MQRTALKGEIPKRGNASLAALFPFSGRADHDLEFTAEVLGLSQNFIGTLRNQDKNKTQRVPVPRGTAVWVGNWVIIYLGSKTAVFITKTILDSLNSSGIEGYSIHENCHSVPSQPPAAGMR